MGAVVNELDPPAYVHVGIVARRKDPTAAADAFLSIARDYTGIELPRVEGD